MAFGPSNLAPWLLIWRSRVDQGVVRWPAHAGTHLLDRFAEHLAAHRTSHHVDDYRIAIKSYSITHPSLKDWYGAILADFAHTLVFEDGAPRLRCMSLSLWRQATALIDPDGLIALRLAQTSRLDSSPSRLVCELPNWRYFPTAVDHGLELVLNRGLADIHVHFEASDPVPLLWLRLACGKVEVQELQFYSDDALAALSEDRRERDRRYEDRRWLVRAPIFLEGLARALGLSIPELGDEITDVLAPLRAERIILVAAWQKVLAGCDDNFLRVLDKYLFSKSLFLRRHQQSAGRGPGLTRFRDFLDRGETLGERRQKRAKQVVRQRRFERMLSLATEPRSLCIVELRVAPQKTLRGWYDLFTLWERIRARHASEWKARANGRGLEVRFVVHFIRSMESNRKAPTKEFESLRRVLDRQTAILQLFRHQQPQLARYIVGIDVANIERGCPPPIFAPYLQLLRGSQELAGQFHGNELLDTWGRLDDLDLAKPPAGLPKLGLTYHAGEDFYHPLDGLRAISGLLDNLLVPGDRIGHGLAVGWDVARFSSERGAAPLPLGVLFDNLVWLRRETAEIGAWTGASRLQGDKLLLELGRNIYEDDLLLSVLERSLDAQFRLPGRLPFSGERVKKSPEIVLAERNTNDTIVEKRRSAYCDYAHMAVLNQVENLIPAVQSKLARELRDDGIVIEANPSSNYATGTIPSLDQHPYFSYLKALDDQVIVTINTDDPGVFGTTLEIEFGLMFEALLRNDYDRGKALDILERSRSTALAYAFGPANTA